MKPMRSLTILVGLLLLGACGEALAPKSPVIRAYLGDDVVLSMPGKSIQAARLPFEIMADLQGFHDAGDGQIAVTSNAVGSYDVTLQTRWRDFSAAATAWLQAQLRRNDSILAIVAEWDVGDPTAGETTWNGSINLQVDDTLTVWIARAGTGVGADQDITVLGDTNGTTLTLRR